MAADDRTGSGSTWPDGSVDPGEGDPRSLRPSTEPPQGSLPQQSPPPPSAPPPSAPPPSAPQQSPPPASAPPPTPAIPYAPLPYPAAALGPNGFVQPPGYPPQPGYGPPGFVQPPGYSPQPGYGPPGFVQPPGYPPPGGWLGSPYPQSGWGYPPGFGIMPFVPAGPAPGLTWGGIGVRFGALLIDAVVLGITFLIAVLLAEAAGIRHYADGSVVNSTAATAIYWIWIIFLVAYHPVCWYAFGGSLGQRVLGLRVVRAADGLKIGLGAVLIRYVIFAVSTVTVIFGIIAAAMANEDPFKRAWHDEAARSVVVRRS